MPSVRLRQCIDLSVKERSYSSAVQTIPFGGLVPLMLADESEVSTGFKYRPGWYEWRWAANTLAYLEFDGGREGRLIPRTANQVL